MRYMPYGSRDQRLESKMCPNRELAALIVACGPNLLGAEPSGALGRPAPSACRFPHAIGFHVWTNSRLMAVACPDAMQCVHFTRAHMR